MAVIYSTTGDGRIESHYTSQNPTWALSRDAATGTAVTTNESFDGNFVAVTRFGARGGGPNTYKVERTFLTFDVSGVDSEVVDVSLNIHGYDGSMNAGSIWGVKGDSYIGSLAVGQFDGITGYSAGNIMYGNVTDYTGVIVTGNWDVSDWNELVGTSSLKADMQSENSIIIVLTDYLYDARNTAPSSNGTWQCGGYYTDNTGTDKDPHLEFKLAGYGHVVNTIAPSSIGKVNTVESGSIEKINTVD